MRLHAYHSQAIRCACCFYHDSGMIAVLQMVLALDMWRIIKFSKLIRGLYTADQQGP